METVNVPSPPPEVRDTAPSPNPASEFDFQKEKKKYDKIIGDFSDEQKRVKERREIRENRKNVVEERAKGSILEDETIIPDRTINTNIRIGRGPYLAYLTQATRFLIMTEIDKPSLSIEDLELWFTRGMRYPKWKIPWIRLIDGMHTHGGCSLEVMYDPEKPFHVSIDYIPRESLIFPKKTKNLQAQPHILREYEITTLQLDEFAEEYGFDPSVVKEIQQKHEEDIDACIKVYRALCKKHGVVYSSWYAPECDRTWLRAPELHDIGLFSFESDVIMQPTPGDGKPLFLSEFWGEIRDQLLAPLPLKLYPIFWFSYETIENEVLLEGQGRVALDIHVQEALTSLFTSVVNGSHRASKFYPCLKNDPTQSADGLELQPLRPGEVYPRELAQFQPNWPNNIILAVSQALQIGKASEAGHSDYAATARKDANKTATEMELASQQAQTNSTSDMDTFSSPVLDVFALAFTVAVHQSLYGIVKRPISPELLLTNVNLVPAGDVEVVKRSEDKENAEKFFAMVQGTPAAEKVLSFMIQRFFPDQADEWLMALAGPDQGGMIKQLVNVLTGLVQDLGDELPPDQRVVLQTVIAQASSMVGGGNNGATPQQPQGPSIAPAPESPANAEAA